MGGREGRSTTPTTVVLRDVSYKIKVGVKAKAFPTVWESVAEPVKGVVGWMRKRTGGRKGGRKGGKEGGVEEVVEEEEEEEKEEKGGIKVVEGKAAERKRVSSSSSSGNSSGKTKSSSSSSSSSSSTCGCTRTVVALENISTVFEPTKMYLVLGGPKAGKTSLLKVRREGGREGGREEGRERGCVLSYVFFAFLCICFSSYPSLPPSLAPPRQPQAISGRIQSSSSSSSSPPFLLPSLLPSLTRFYTKAQLRDPPSFPPFLSEP